jgi:hypothetical protein
VNKVRDAFRVEEPTKSKKVPSVEQAFVAPGGKGDNLCLDVLSLLLVVAA